MDKNASGVDKALRITDIKTAVVEVRLPSYNHFPDGGTCGWILPEAGTYEWMLVRVYTDEGITGIGETHSAIGAKQELCWLKKHIVGENPLDLNRLYPLTRGKLGSGLELALWDIFGKALGVPLHVLLGGKFRDEVRIYADSGGPAGWMGGLESTDPDSWAKRAKDTINLGFDALKFDVDTPLHWRFGFNRCLSTEEIGLIVKDIEAVRSVIGERSFLAIDFHEMFSPQDAVKLANRLEPYDLAWIEDPIPYGSGHDIDLLVKVSAKIKTPICTGEVLKSRFDFKKLIEKHAVDIIGPDIRTVGGLTEMKKVGDLADLNLITMALHNMATPIGTIASAHFCASIQNFLILEFHHQDTPWWGSLIKGSRPLIEHGHIRVPEKPGLGIELDDGEVMKHLKEGESPC
jgi:L-alanine-DL-glutamate epimerase-like enolase superfamily enzyme